MGDFANSIWFHITNVVKVCNKLILANGCMSDKIALEDNKLADRLLICVANALGKWVLSNFNMCRMGVYGSLDLNFVK